MSLFIMVDFNNETKQLLYQKQKLLVNNFDGEFETFDKFHITLKFLDENDGDMNKAIEAMVKLDKINLNKFEIIAKDFHNFDGGTYWIGVNNSLELYKIKYKIEEILKSVNYNLKPEKFDGYTPHITMGYNLKKKNKFNEKFEGIPIIIDNICLWHSYKVNGEYMQNVLYRINLK